VTCRISFLGVKWPGREANHSYSSKAEVRNRWSCTSVLPICFQGVARDNFIFSFFLSIRPIVLRDNVQRHVPVEYFNVVCTVLAF
jgi:hypothetical protein